MSYPYYIASPHGYITPGAPPNYYNFNNKPYIERIVTYPPLQASRGPFPLRPIEEEYYVNIPLNEYIIVQSLKMNTRGQSKDGRKWEKSQQGPLIVLNYSSPDGLVPLKTIFPQVNIMDGRDEGVRKI